MRGGLPRLDPGLSIRIPLVRAERATTLRLPWGSRFYAHGLEANRRTMEQFAATAYRLGLTDRLVAVDDYFAEFLAS